MYKAVQKSKVTQTPDLLRHKNREHVLRLKATLTVMKAIINVATLLCLSLKVGGTSRLFCCAIIKFRTGSVRRRW